MSAWICFAGWSQKAKQDANVLSLALGELNEGEIVALAKDLSSGDSFRDAVWRGLRIAATVAPEREVAFALAVVECPSPDSEERNDATAQARRALVEFLASRPSNFDVRRLCAGLSLPELR